jgi:hypothetical protein
MPIPAGLVAAGKLVGLLGPSVGKFFGAKKASDSLSQTPDEITAQFEQLKKDMPQYGVGSAWNQYLAMSKQDPAADMQRQIAAEQEASSIGALKAGGAKALLGGLGASQRAAAQNRMGIEAASQARQQSALGQFAGVQQEMDMRNTMLGQNLEGSKFEAVRGAEQRNKELDAYKKQALGDAFASGLGMFGQGLLGSGGSGSAADAAKSYSGGLGDFNLSPVGAFGSETGTGNFSQASLGDYSIPSTSGMGLSAAQRAQMPFMFGRFKKGGMTTPGEFSHETNPIDMMKDGAKIGEMTGGEAILNPEQQKKAAKESPYFRKLMREFAMRNRK